MQLKPTGIDTLALTSFSANVRLRFIGFMMRCDVMMRDVSCESSRDNDVYLQEKYFIFHWLSSICA